MVVTSSTSTNMPVSVTVACAVHRPRAAAVAGKLAVWARGPRPVVGSESRVWRISAQIRCRCSPQPDLPRGVGLGLRLCWLPDHDSCDYGQGPSHGRWARDPPHPHGR